MGGEINATVVYGFEVKKEYVRLRGCDCYISAKARWGYPVYYCVDLQCLFPTLDIMELHAAVSKLDQKTQDKMAEFDKFAAKYGYTASWQICCVGDFEVKMANNSKQEIIERLRNLEREMENNSDEYYNFDFDSMSQDLCYSASARDSIEIILLEENMGFMVKDALKTDRIDAVIDMVDAFYTLE